MKKNLFYIGTLSLILCFAFVLYALHSSYRKELDLFSIKQKELQLSLVSLRHKKTTYLSTLRSHLTKDKQFKTRRFERELFRYIHERDKELEEFQLVSVKRHTPEELGLCQRIVIELSFCSTWKESQLFLKDIRSQKFRVFFQNISFESDQVNIDYVRGQVDLVIFLLN